MEINMISWFEIPVTDIDRAKEFYEKVFNIEISVQDFNGVKMGWFPPAEDVTAIGCNGSLVEHENYIPSATHGSLVYFNSRTGDCTDELNRIEEAGGTILQKKTLISKDIGYMALFLDSEGNRVALYNK